MWLTAVNERQGAQGLITSLLDVHLSPLKPGHSCCKIQVRLLLAHSYNDRYWAPVMKTFFAPFRFVRHAMRGHWLRPWRSPYLRWRIETYSGIPAETIDARIFWRFLFEEKGRLLQFLRWTSEMAAYAHFQANRRST